MSQTLTPFLPDATGFGVAIGDADGVAFRDGDGDAEGWAEEVPEGIAEGATPRAAGSPTTEGNDVRVCKNRSPA
jgi:hypothetical protein